VDESEERKIYKVRIESGSGGIGKEYDEVKQAVKDIYPSIRWEFAGCSKQDGKVYETLEDAFVEYEEGTKIYISLSQGNILELSCTVFSEEQKMSKAVIIYSGGLDSTVLLTKCKQGYDEVVALNFNYGSKHNKKERASAHKVCDKLGVELIEVNLPFINELFKSDLLQSGGIIPNGHYEDPTMKKTVVPYRNSIMLSIAAGFAESIGAKYVAIANHAGDHEIYPDCRRGYIKAFAAGIRLGGYGEIIIHSPFVDMTKAEIVKLGAEISAPMELSWSCYKGEERPCLSCGTCQERTISFFLNNIKDPSLSNEEWVEALKVIGR